MNLLDYYDKGKLNANARKIKENKIKSKHTYEEKKLPCTKHIIVHTHTHPKQKQNQTI